MEDPTEYLHALPGAALASEAPECFTFPFHYQPHPLAEAAAHDLQEHLRAGRQWSYDFGIDSAGTGSRGKMFGVLVVRAPSGALSYLAAYSGKLAESNHLPGFVPPVYDLLDERGFYRPGESAINEVTEALEAFRGRPDFREARERLGEVSRQAEEELRAERAVVKRGKKDRRRRREEATTLPDAERQALEDRLAAESIRHSYGLKDLTRALKHRVALAEEHLRSFTERESELVDKRRRMSATLQQRIFREYTFLDATGVERGLGSLFEDTPMGVPPAGAGECAAPKLLQFAYRHELAPVALAEFWWGEAPDSEIRRHRVYYPACRGKCEPILSHMLRGLRVDPNPLLVNPAVNKVLTYLYEDDHLIVVNKPHDFLSVPGKHIEDSVYTRIRRNYPSATGPLVAHRLDMSTSGLLLVSKSKDVHRLLQRQFFRRTVEKRYRALVEAEVAGDSGTIDLPLRGDLTDRPRQMVCHEAGKPARTHWEVVERVNGRTLLDLYPVTGRTHQLRVHCAHPDGLGTPIVGDDLYGRTADRLCLHAAAISFVHPVSKERLNFSSEADFQ